jgi:hypothetical protein
MNKAYIIWPFVGLLVFGAFYLNFNRTFTERQKQEQVRVQQEKRERQLKEAEQRRLAVVAANEAVAKRNAEREARDKQEEADRQARIALIDRRNRAFDDVNKRLRPQLERLRNDAGDIKDQIAKLEQEKKEYANEETFLRTYVRKAEANQQTYVNLLEQLAAAEKARAEAAAKARRS